MSKGLYQRTSANGIKGPLLELPSKILGPFDSLEKIEKEMKLRRHVGCCGKQGKTPDFG